MPKFDLSGTLSSMGTAATPQGGGMGSKIGTAAGTGLGAMFGPAGASIGGAAGGILGGLFDKPEGIPAPLTGTEAGLFQKDFFNSAFPETTAWERLGSSQSGAPQQANLMKQQTDTFMQDKELAVRSDLTDKTNRAHVISSLAPFGPEGINFGLNKYSTSIGFKDGFDTAIKQGREKLPSEIHERTQTGNLKSAETGLADEKARRRKEIVDSEIHQRQYGSASSSAASAAKGAANMFADSSPFLNYRPGKWMDRIPMFKKSRNHGAGGKF